MLGKHLRKFRSHLLYWAEAVGLEKSQDSSGKSLQCCKGSGDLVGIMAEIIDHRDLMLGSDDIEPARKALKCFDCRNGLSDRHSDSAAGRYRRERIGDIVPTGHLQ